MFEIILLLNTMQIISIAIFLYLFSHFNLLSQEEIFPKQCWNNYFTGLFKFENYK